ncbi:MAG: hypothetical protein K2R98_13805 [Gemmataceae bacterium]|nr:hypothetical protein [Gemmataceae bacterium]
MAGGSFDVTVAATVDFDPGSPLSKLILQNGGAFRKLFDAPTVIKIPVENNGGTFEIGLASFPGAGLLVQIDVPANTTGYAQTAGSTFLHGNTLQVVGDVRELGGTIALSNGTLEATGMVHILQGATLDGPGAIVGSVTNAGLIRVRGDDNVAGTLAVTNIYSQRGTGVLFIIATGNAPDRYDRLQVHNALLDGALRVEFSNYSPQVGDRGRPVHDSSIGWLGLGRIL